MNEVQGRRLHPMTIFYSALRIVPQLAIGFLVMRNFKEGLVELIIYLVIALLLLPSLLIYYFNFRFYISADGIVIHSGLLFKNNRTIPIDRIQNVDIVQNALMRVFRIASVKIETAGGKSTEGKLEYVSIDQAHAIRHEIESLQSYVSSDESANSQKFVEKVDDTPFFSLSNNDLFRGGLTRLSPVVLFAAGLFGQYNFVLRKLVENNKTLNAATEWIVDNVWIFIVVTLLFSLFVSWIGGIVLHCARYYGFKIVTKRRAVITDAGLLSKRHSIIPTKKMQSIARRANPIMRLFGLEYVEVHTAGSAENGAKSAETLFPVMRKQKTAECVDTLFALQFPDTYVSIFSKKAYYYCIIRDSIVTVLPFLVSAFLISAYFFIPAALMLVFIFAVEKFRLTIKGYSLSDGYIFIRTGVWTITQVAIPYTKIQVLTHEQSIVERWAGFAHLTVSTAGGSFSFHGSIPFLKSELSPDLVSFLLHSYRLHKKKRRLVLSHHRSTDTV
ncbi:MAG: PH domain-containing protein [Candidatus Kapaibacterium sp.]|jgi:putative membrane protein